MGKKDPNFPFKSVLSLEPIISQWRSIAESSEEPVQADLARIVLASWEKTPAIHGDIYDIAVLQEHADVVKSLLSISIPLGASDSQIAGVNEPFEFNCFYQTRLFEELNFLEHMHNHFEQAFSSELFAQSKAIIAYSWVLEKRYGIVDNESKFPIFVPVKNETNGLTRYFKVEFDTTYCEIRFKKGFSEPSEDEIAILRESRTDLDLWKDKLPPDHIAFRGIVIITATDVTEGAVVSGLKRNLLQPDSLSTPQKIDEIQSQIRSLLHLPQIEVGLIAIEGEELDIKEVQPLGRSLLLSRGVVPSCSTWKRSLYAKVARREAGPVVIGDLNRLEDKTGFEEYLCEQGYRNIILAPLFADNELVGVLELASPNPFELDQFSLSQLEEVTSLFGVAIHRKLGERDDRVQALIKEQYTSIHPAVEWRFEKAARNYLAQEENQEETQVESIVFHDVYPLYGLADIRGSSTERNASIQADLLYQLGLALNVLIQIQRVKPLFAIDEVGYRLNQFAAEIEKELRSGDEISILNFLKDEVEPLFDDFRFISSEVEAHVEDYLSQLDPELGIIYLKRKDYEDSVSQINNCIAKYFQDQQVHAQSMFPHYFEMYKTDGVDYNIYVGASLAEDGNFSKLYLQNLRLWQLMSTCGVFWELEDLMPQLKKPLKTASLILVQDIPLSIRFRIDEKQFDVDGAYNIRYEIVKKRIDKARILRTGERLTQPGMIAIVYSQDSEAREYKRYLTYLQASGYLKDEIEDLELEDLQGVYGLKALRVHIADNRPDDDLEIQALSSVEGDGQQDEAIQISVNTD